MPNMDTLSFPISNEDLSRICDRWGIKELYLFGSALYKNTDSASDLDLLVTFEAESVPSLFELETLNDELEQTAGCKVDIMTRAAVERSKNRYLRNNILRSAQLIYQAE